MTLVHSDVAPATPRRNPHTDDERLALLRCLLADRSWTQDAAQRALLLHVLAALRAPGGMPLDEAQWTLLADETARYLEFRRQQSLERQLCGLHGTPVAHPAPRLH
ncbi:MAG: hypothetical protein QM795_10660 [Pseudoxanthomonas sp.]